MDKPFSLINFPYKEIKTMNPVMKQMIEKSVATFVQAFLSVFVVTDMSSAKTALASAVAAGLSVVKSWASTKVGDPASTNIGS
tara:strand:- start:278 stop:526 length:249 start_codon:yes stop_codon:yes gene_type:complete